MDIFTVTYANVIGLNELHNFHMNKNLKVIWGNRTKTYWFYCYASLPFSSNNQKVNKSDQKYRPHFHVLCEKKLL